ncbi:MAG TPA: hypothetical protein VIS96_15890 [Terrimicrobiaceae bacterium]
MDHSVPRKGRHLVMVRVFILALSIIVLAGCESIDTGAASRAAMNESIRRELPGNYFIGRRMYKVEYKVWGWVREPGKPWNTAKLVMLNEQRVLAPDRAQGKLGTDNNYEYRLTGYFSGDTIYEPASNGFYPEFVILGAEVKSTSAPNIYQERRQNDPKVRILQPPS